MSSRDQPMSQWPSTHEFVIPVADGADEVTLTIDGRELRAPRGELLIRVAQDHGTYIPRFCYHERMKPVGMCRMCLVEVEGMRGLQISCATPVADGMVVHTKSDEVRGVQDGVLEFLLINHPLDCSVCDRGGECPLQDQTFAFGPGESRFVEEKRHFAKPIPISDLILLDRERCIQCGRCTRFASEIAGDPLIDFGGRGADTEVITFPDEPFSSYFSGNIVQICPVGALTAQPYRFKARPWDLQTAETSCTTCAVGCRGALDSSSNRLVRLLGVDSEPINHGWLCDKGRFSYEAVHSWRRVRAPMVRKEGELVECSWPEALDAAAAGIRAALDAGGPESVALLGGARGTNEDAYLWARLAKGVIGTDSVDAQLADGLPAELALGLPGATIADCDRAAGIVLLGADLKEELPVLSLRIKRAADDLGVPLVEIGACETGLSRYATASIRTTPGEQATVARKLAQAIGGATTGDASVDAAGAALRAGDPERPIVVILGRPSVAESADATVQAAAELAEVGDRIRFLSALRRGNVRGALELGLTPGFLPGRLPLDVGASWIAARWRACPSSRGRDATGILSAAADGEIGALMLVGADVLSDFPDRARARAGLDGAGFAVAVGAFVTETAESADVFLPTTTWGEEDGTTTNLEGRVLRLSRKVSPDGTPMPGWRIAAELAARLGADFDLEHVEEVQDEIARVAPSFSGVDADLVGRAVDGVVLPKADHESEIQLAPRRIPVTDMSWEPIPPAGRSTDSTGPGTETDASREESESTESTDDAGSNPPESGPAADPVPGLYRWDGDVASSIAPARDAYALRLVAGRALYDVGCTVTESPSLAVLAPGSVLLVNRADRDRIGVDDGGEVRVTTTRGSVTLPVRADAATPVGVAFLAFNQAGTGAADLIDVSEAVTDLRVESVR